MREIQSTLGYSQYELAIYLLSTELAMRLHSLASQVTNLSCRYVIKRSVHLKFHTNVMLTATMIMQQWHTATTTRHSYTLTYQDLQTFD